MTDDPTLEYFNTRAKRDAINARLTDDQVPAFPNLAQTSTDLEPADAADTSEERSVSTPDIDFPEYPTDRSYASIERHYRQQFPLLDAYLAVIEQYNTGGPRGPITEPHDVPGAVDTLRGAQLALERIGRPTRDPLIIHMAEKYISALSEEIGQLADDVTPTLDSVVIGYFYPFAACIPDAQAWQSWERDEQDAAVEEIVAAMPVEVLHEAVKLAMPAILEKIVANDEAARHGRG